MNKEREVVEKKLLKKLFCCLSKFELSSSFHADISLKIIKILIL